MAKKNTNVIGSWAFIIGVVVAVILGALGSKFGAGVTTWLTLLLFAVGIIVGVLNVTSDEVMGFLTTSAILVFVSFVGGQAMQVAAQNSGIVQALINIFNSLMVLFVPATIVVALRAVFTLARD